MPRVYDELRKLASYKISQQIPGQTLSGTALLHEAYLRISKEEGGAKWASERQFFSAAAEAMRRILIDRIRAKRRVKRGGELKRVDLEEEAIESPASDSRLLEINEALDEFEKVDPENAELVKLRYFAGMTLEEIAQSTGVPVRTLTRRWTYARSWLSRQLSRDD